MLQPTTIAMPKKTLLARMYSSLHIEQCRVPHRKGFA